MTLAGKESRWQVPDWTTFQVVRFEEGVLLFHPASGLTHHPSELALEILEMLAPGALSLEEVARTLGVGREEEEARVRLEEVLGALDRLGLIAPVAAGSKEA